jgi:hypothetical protein
MSRAISTRIPEEAMLKPLLGWLRSRRWIRCDTVIAPEFSWSGRRVDLVTITRSGVSTSYELKVANFGKVLYQSSLNCHVFDRNYIVVPTSPSRENLEHARQLGIGVLVIHFPTEHVTIASRPSTRAIDPRIRNAVREKLLLREFKSNVW